MPGRNHIQFFSFLLTCALSWCCGDRENPVKHITNYIPPQYDLVQLYPAQDTITFPLDEHTYNVIKSFNVFSQSNVDYISFYDHRSASVNIYNFHSRTLIKKVLLKKSFPGEKLYKTTVYAKSFDSIFVNNNTMLYLLDTSGKIKKSLDFLKKPRFSWAIFENTNQPVFKGKWMYAAVRPYVNETSLKALKEWKVLYRFDLENNNATLHYHLPELYQKNLYGYHFLDYSYCYNNRGNFIFSFPADPTVYESNLANYYYAFYGKSRFQTDSITPVRKEYLLKDEGSKQYSIRDSYGPIYFDPYRKRYLRLAKQKITGQAYDSKNKRRKESAIIFDEHLRIIGESEIENNFHFGSLFFAPNGNMYARIKLQDEYALHFIRLIYSDDQNKKIELTKYGN